MSRSEIASTFALAFGISIVAYSTTLLADYKPPENTVFLQQGWSQEDRLRYYQYSQGSAALSYDIFLNLERADSTELFRSDANMSSYGFVPQSADPTYNPDALPIGITKTVVTEGPWKGQWAGLGCAACHNGQLEYKGTKIRISGGNANTLDILAFIGSLDDALSTSANDPEKFGRLAGRLNLTNGAEREALRKRLNTDAAGLQRYRNFTSLSPFDVGPGRMDALGLIHNQVQANILGIPENWRSAVAPVKPSFVWNVPQSAWAQWSGVLKDPVLRNVGEVLGVFAKIDLTSKTPADGLFNSTVDLAGQLATEELLRRLAPPPWPEDILGKIDRVKAAKGKELFAENCSSCHSTWPHRWSEPKIAGKRFIENAIVSGEVIGTDASQFGSPQFELTRPTVVAGPLSDYLEPPYKGQAIVPPPASFAVALNGVFDTAMAKLGLSEEERISAHGYRASYPDDQDPIPALFAYKANPAEGMWSSPPYLHNGSVPNLFELLSPAADRSKTFFIGRDFDPIKVGVDTSGASGKFLFDTTLFGNANVGHSFEDGPRQRGVIGRRLSEEERWALIEYMKSVPEQPAQITPFGGPEHPVRAWTDPTFYHVKNPGTYNGAPKLPATGSKLGEEMIEPSESDFIASITKATLQRLQTQFPAGTRPVLRDAHPKTHSLVRAQFIVLDDLPEDLRYGVFAKPRTYDAIIRFSAGGIEVQSDKVPQANGMAIKLLGVEGDKILTGQRDAKTQDFVMINNFPSFFVKNLADYEALHETLGNGDPTSALAKFFQNHPEEALAVRAMRGDEPLTNPLHARYFSQTPYKLGPSAIKFAASAVAGESSANTEMSGPDFLRKALEGELAEGDAYFDFSVQMQLDPVAMPVENSLVVWDEARSPYRRVAIIRIPKQDVAAANAQEIVEGLSFDPWHSLPDHRPLGSINRARKVIYEELSKFRHDANGLSMQEPTKIPW